MFDYLLSYGVERHTPAYQELDIHDKLMLQDQINTARRGYFEMLQLMDEVQSKMLEVSERMKQESKRVMEQAGSEGVRPNSLFSQDDEYLSLEAKKEALSAGMNLITEQLNFYKNDLRILNSAFYAKF